MMYPVMGWVIGPNPDDPDSVMVAFRSGQVVGHPVKMLHHGYADGLRVHQKPLPERGTAGVVLFPNCDIRNAVWAGSLYVNKVDAITGDPGDMTIDYEAHWSGYWRLLDKLGQESVSWPDGSSLVVGSGTALPAPTRHIVDSGGARQQIAYAETDRIPSPPGAFHFTYAHKSGTTHAIDPAGNVTVTGGAGATLTANFGGSTYVMDASGNITINGKSGATITINYNGATLGIDTQGNIIIDVPTGRHVLSSLNGGGTSDALALVSKLVAAFNAHTHPGDSGGTTGTPTVPWSAATVESDIFGITS